MSLLPHPPQPQPERRDPWKVCGQVAALSIAVLSLTACNECCNIIVPNYAVGIRQGATVYVQPNPPAYTFAAWSSATPSIRIDKVSAFAGTVNVGGIYQPTTQLVYGQVAGSISGMAVVVYSFTNDYYIQPLTSTTIDVSAGDTWIAPVNAGTISALLIRQGYSVPDTTSTLPAVDGINVIAAASQP
jgi:hypothetical protein